ncbi:Protein of unknown function [Gryllus bimaculatus]|nr:Protein of unknown function [Gryllus bimaculatus]
MLIPRFWTMPALHQCQPAVPEQTSAGLPLVAHGCTFPATPTPVRPSGRRPPPALASAGDRRRPGADQGGTCSSVETPRAHGWDEV